MDFLGICDCMARRTIAALKARRLCWRRHGQFFINTAKGSPSSTSRARPFVASKRMTAIEPGF